MGAVTAQGEIFNVKVGATGGAAVWFVTLVAVYQIAPKPTTMTAQPPGASLPADPASQ